MAKRKVVKKKKALKEVSIMLPGDILVFFNKVASLANTDLNTVMNVILCLSLMREAAKPPLSKATEEIDEPVPEDREKSEPVLSPCAGCEGQGWHIYRRSEDGRKIQIDCDTCDGSGLVS